MKATRPPLFCVFDEPRQAESAVYQLLKQGIDHTHIFTANVRPTQQSRTQLQPLFRDGVRSMSRAVDTLVTQGIPLDEAQYYAQAYEAGHAIIAVQLHQHPRLAVEILCRRGAISAL